MPRMVGLALTKGGLVRHKEVGRFWARVWIGLQEEFFPLGCFESRM